MNGSYLSSRAFEHMSSAYCNKAGAAGLAPLTSVVAVVTSDPVGVFGLWLSRRTLVAAASSGLALALLAGGYFLLTGCQPSPARKSPPARMSVSSPLTSPFTGKRIKALGPELIFKIDNVPQARPPTGLKHADIV